MVAPIASTSTAKSTLLNNPAFRIDPTCGFFGGSLKGLCSQQQNQKPRNKSRDGFSLVVASSSSSNPNTTTSGRGSDGDRFYFNFTGFPFPLGPFLNRRTSRTEVSFFFSTSSAVQYLAKYILTKRVCDPKILKKELRCSLNKSDIIIRASLEYFPFVELSSGCERLYMAV